MNYKEIHIPQSDALELSQIKEMDYYAVENFDLPIELMMENAGLQLANLVAGSLGNPKANILIGVGNGNNGGGGLVAARRLAAWGYPVYISAFLEIDKELPKKQWNRAVKFGAKTEPISHPDIWIDAYLGFSQRLPLNQDLQDIIEDANHCDCHRISLDIPTGFLGDVSTPHFKADQILSLAASKKVLYNLPNSTDIFIADLGIPGEVYERFGINPLPFRNHNILKILRDQ